MGYTIQRLLQDNSTYSRDDFVFFWGHTDRKEGVGKCCYDGREGTYIR